MAEEKEAVDTPFVVVGIDYGTTYAGAAWAKSGDLDQIEVISQWSGSNAVADSDKVPSDITYDDFGKPEKWGFGSKPNDNNTLRWAKLLLSSLSLTQMNSSDEDVVDKTRKRMTQLRKKAVDVIADYLRFLWTHITTRLRIRLTPPVFDNMVLKVVLTIPAIWDHKAQQNMLKAAEKAGIQDYRACGKTEISLIAEPAAAALATFFDSEIKRNPNIGVGDSFVVCDAGGGTVDLISYKIKSFSPFRLTECIGVSGDLCGAIYLDRAFLTHIKAFRKHMNQLDPDTEKRFMEKEWETILKKTFDGTKGPWVVELPQDSQSGKRAALKTIFKKPESNLLSLEGGHLKQVFNKVVTKIIDLLKDQVSGVEVATGSKPKVIILVGGFGGNEYLLKEIQKVFLPMNIIIQQPPRAWSAVCRGAVHRGVQGGDDIVCNHISKYWYGVRFQKPWEEGKYDITDKWFDKRRQSWAAANQLDWYLMKNKDVQQIQSVEHGFSAIYKDASELKKKQYIIYYTDKDEPGERIADHIRPLCRLKLDLSNFAFTDFAIYRKEGQTTEYREVNTVLKMDITVASINWSATCLGRDVRVDVEYIESNSSAIVPT